MGDEALYKALLVISDRSLNRYTDLPRLIEVLLNIIADAQNILAQVQTSDLTTASIETLIEAPKSSVPSPE